jgi:hypothetical protein
MMGNTDVQEDQGMNLATTTAQLRWRLYYWRNKLRKGFRVIAEEMGLNEQTVRAFLDEKSVSLGSVEKMEAWCDAQEQTRRDVKEGQ